MCVDEVCRLEHPSLKEAECFFERLKCFIENDSCKRGLALPYEKVVELNDLPEECDQGYMAFKNKARELFWCGVKSMLDLYYRRSIQKLKIFGGSHGPGQYSEVHFWFQSYTDALTCLSFVKNCGGEEV